MKEMKLEIPEGCEVDKIETQDSHIVVTFKEKERKLPKNWEEFCEMYPVNPDKEVYIGSSSEFREVVRVNERLESVDRNVLPDRATAEAVLALCQLIQLRNCYNGDWVPDWTDGLSKYVIQLDGGRFVKYDWYGTASSPLYFKTIKLRDEFLHNFRPLIEKLKPLYGIKEGGEK